jgi:hypothetical protein
MEMKTKQLETNLTRIIRKHASTPQDMDALIQLWIKQRPNSKKVAIYLELLKKHPCPLSKKITPRSKVKQTNYLELGDLEDIDQGHQDGIDEYMYEQYTETYERAMRTNKHLMALAKNFYSNSKGAKRYLKRCLTEWQDYSLIQIIGPEWDFSMP